MKQAFVGRLTGIHALHSPRDVNQVEGLDELTLAKPTEPDSKPASIDRDDRFYTASSVHKASSEMEFTSYDDEEAEIEGDYAFEDNEVMVPWGPPMSQLADNGNMAEVEVEVEVEGVYSDDELFEGEYAHQVGVLDL